MAKCQHWDLALMDVQMPEMSGPEAVAAIRQRERTEGGHLPVIAITADAMPSARRECLEAGMDGYVSKPIQTQELWALIERLTGRPACPPEGAAGPADPERPTSMLDGPDILRRLGGSRRAMDRVARTFRESCPRMLAEMRLSIMDRRDDSLKRLAHTLKGSVGIFGQTLALKAITDVETAARQGNFAAAQAACDIFAREVAALQLCLDALMKENAPCTC